MINAWVYFIDHPHVFVYVYAICAFVHACMCILNSHDRPLPVQWEETVGPKTKTKTFVPPEQVYMRMHDDNVGSSAAVFFICC